MSEEINFVKRIRRCLALALKLCTCEPFLLANFWTTNHLSLWISEYENDLVCFCTLMRYKAKRLRERNKKKETIFRFHFNDLERSLCSHTEDKTFYLIPVNLQFWILGALAFYQQPISCQIRSSHYFIWSHCRSRNHRTRRGFGLQQQHMLQWSQLSSCLSSFNIR